MMMMMMKLVTPMTPVYKISYCSYFYAHFLQTLSHAYFNITFIVTNMLHCLVFLFGWLRLDTQDVSAINNYFGHLVQNDLSSHFLLKILS
jgi:hypothetical protein